MSTELMPAHIRQQWNFLLQTYGKPRHQLRTVWPGIPRTPVPSAAPPRSRVRAQIILWIDDQGTIHAESPGRNGSREKLDITIPPSLRAELQIRADESRERDRLEDAERHRRVWDVTARHHNRGSESGEEFATRTIGSRRSAKFWDVDVSASANATTSATKPKTKAKVQEIDPRFVQILDLESI